jgi:hypothetical protein
MGSVKPAVAPVHIAAGASLVLAACATLPTPEYPSTHPANPAAPAAIVMPTPSTLRTYNPFSGASARESAASSTAGQTSVPQAEQPGKEDTDAHHR